MKLQVARAIAFAFLLGSSFPGTAAAESTRILLVGTAPDHPWASHMYALECEILAKCLEQTPDVECETVVGWPVEAQRLAELDAVVFYSRPAGELVLHPDHRELFLDLMQRGAGLTAIHWGTGVGYGELADEPDIRERYKSLLGGWFRKPPCDIKTTTAVIRQLDPRHPLCFGWQEYEIHDEFYLNPVLHGGANPVLQVEVDGQPHTVAWSFERAAPYGGRSVGITLGHFHKNFERADFRRALVNAILWSAHVDVPKKGAPVKLDASALELPERPVEE